MADILDEIVIFSSQIFYTYAIMIYPEKCPRSTFGTFWAYARKEIRQEWPFSHLSPHSSLTTADCLVALT